MLEDLRVAADAQLSDLVADEAMCGRFLAVCSADGVFPRRSNGAFLSAVTAIGALSVMVVLLLATPAPRDAANGKSVSMLELLIGQVVSFVRNDAAAPPPSDTADTSGSKHEDALEPAASPQVHAEDDAQPQPPADDAPETSAALPSSTALYPVQVSGKHGYMNASGVLIIAPQYDSAAFFENENYAVVGVNAADAMRYGLVHSDGSSIECTFREIGIFDELDIAPALDLETDFWGYINARGQWMVSPAFDAAGTFVSDRATVTYQNVLGSIDRDGIFADQETVPLPIAEMTLPPPPPAEALTQRSATLVAPGTDTWIFGVQGSPTLLGVMDLEGNVIVPPVFPVLQFIGDDGYIYGVSLAADQIGFGMLSRRGSLVAAHDYSMLVPCPGGGAYVARPRNQAAVGLLDANGAWTLEPHYNSITFFDGALAHVEGYDEDQQFQKGYVDAQGNWVRTEN